MFCNNTHRKPAFAEIFEGSSEVIDSVVNDKPSVMRPLERMEFRWFIGILSVILRYSFLKV